MCQVLRVYGRTEGTLIKVNPNEMTHLCPNTKQIKTSKYMRKNQIKGGTSNGIGFIHSPMSQCIK